MFLGDLQVKRLTLTIKSMGGICLKKINLFKSIIFNTYVLVYSKNQTNDFYVENIGFEVVKNTGGTIENDLSETPINKKFEEELDHMFLISQLILELRDKFNVTTEVALCSVK